MKIAVFADLHHIYGSRIKGLSLHSALETAHGNGVGFVICAGDMLGNGTADEARDIVAIFDKAKMPVAFTPGNAELRTPAEAENAARLLKSAPLPAGILLLDSSTGSGPAEMLDALPAGGNLLLVTHVPPTSWNGDSREAWLAARRRGAIALTVAGHLHKDMESDGLRLVRGLDPDKALGGPPSFPVLEDGPDGWRISQTCVLPGIDPGEWSADFRRAFREDLGFSTMYDPLGGLDFAIRNNVPNVEVRDASWRPEDFRRLREKIGDWRKAGGRILSTHLPALHFENGECSGIGRLADACRAALDMGCDRGTLHVPEIKVGEYDANLELVRDAFAKALAPVAGTAFKIGVENMHMAPRGETATDRSFGYTPGECQRQVALLRSIGGLDAGYHIDIGHARNNAPFDHPWPVSSWYQLLGAECNGMHIHQVTMKPDGAIANHKALTGCFDPLISLSSLILARREGLLPRVPMFLEIRDNLGPDCYLALSRL